MRKGEKPGEGVKLALVCHHCGKHFEKYRSQIRPFTGGRYCSHLCQVRGTVEKRKRFGPEHGHWKGGVEYRQKAFEAYGQRCQRCGYDRHAELLQVHHKNFKPRKQQDDHSLENLEVLCVRCHMEVHLAFSKSGTAGLHVQVPS